MINPKKLYRSGEITHFTDVSRQTLHYYTQLGLVKEAKKTTSGQRLYDESVFEVLERIKKYQKKGMKLMQIKETLKANAQLKFSFLKKELGDK